MKTNRCFFSIAIALGMLIQGSSFAEPSAAGADSGQTRTDPHHQAAGASGGHADSEQPGKAQTAGDERAAGEGNTSAPKTAKESRVPTTKEPAPGNADCATFPKSQIPAQRAKVPKESRSSAPARERKAPEATASTPWHSIQPAGKTGPVAAGERTAPAGIIGTASNAAKMQNRSTQPFVVSSARVVVSPAANTSRQRGPSPAAIGGSIIARAGQNTAVINGTAMKPKF